MLVITILAAGFVFWLIALIDRKSRQDGGLFSRPPTPFSRILAGFLGAICLVFAFMIFREDRSTAPLLALVGIALCAYALGSASLIRMFQREAPPVSPYAVPDTHPEKQFPLARIARILLILVVGIGGIILVTFLMIWINGNPKIAEPFYWVVVILIIILAPILPVLHAFSIFQHAKRIQPPPPDPKPDPKEPDWPDFRWPE